MLEWQQPRLSESYVLTMEVMSKFLGINTKVGLFTYFPLHYTGWFLELLQVDLMCAGGD